MVIAQNSNSHVRSYFDRFPLYSSKYLAYKDWCRVQDLCKGKTLTLERIEEIKTARPRSSSNRKVFDCYTFRLSKNIKNCRG